MRAERPQRGTCDARDDICGFVTDSEASHMTHSVGTKILISRTMHHRGFIVVRLYIVLCN